ncbi:MAG: tryptophan--tRNA ligase [Dehalococcoidales bacterium]|jgi:tryptophanyl-tRNA synthetase|nr:tryptophan--tRNA ligase [Dehalococcoidales bacterium]MDD3264807.1 tryptophan--tRNA ligase [Dehalococcoidales bacterium]MDD4322250.1 tryptophan--tRNA ligase [Dehalococcoidales bacterium]MDD4794428.1 tryptophan--tRNA ligase [Dehalococcoidales bacterium]MDD5121838.1 tryptophan--tRNA ligase [Dehalococcoidales bacterium]
MKKRIFSGMRPTGRLHIGNYLGALQNWVNMQDEFDCVYCVVDIHALTSLEDNSQLNRLTREMVMDIMAGGIDPQKSILFVQSHVPEVAELNTYLSMITPLSWLLRVPTFKEKVKLQPHNVNYGLVGYPVLMAADILLYKAEAVPVGQDQLPHLELTREIVRRFNTRFSPVFPEPEGRLTDFPIVQGLDGEKMSKQTGNLIELAITAQETTKKIMGAVTDPSRKFRSDPGNPDICNVYRLHGYFNSEEVNEIAGNCRNATIGCVDCKKRLAEKMNQELEPIRERRRELEQQPELVNQVLSEGAEKAGMIARKTMDEVRRVMGLA